MDALFGESSGDEDYDPNAPDPLADAAGAAAGGAEEAEEPEYASDGDAEREALAEVIDLTTAMILCSGFHLIRCNIAKFLLMMCLTATPSARRWPRCAT